MTKENLTVPIGSAMLNNLLYYYKEGHIGFLMTKFDDIYICRVTVNAPGHFQNVLDVSARSRREAEEKAQDGLRQIISILRSLQEE